MYREPELESEHLHTVAELVLSAGERDQLGLSQGARLQGERREDTREGEVRDAVPHRVLQGHTRLALVRDLAAAQLHQAQVLHHAREGQRRQEEATDHARLVASTAAASADTARHTIGMLQPEHWH